MQSKLRKGLYPTCAPTNVADLIVCLSHLGIKVDEPLARAVPDIDIILGGHSHTELKQQRWVERTLIMQCRPHAGTVGRVDIALSRSDDGRLSRNINGEGGRWWGHAGASKPNGFEACEFPAVATDRIARRTPRTSRRAVHV